MRPLPPAVVTPAPPRPFDRSPRTDLDRPAPPGRPRMPRAFGLGSPRLYPTPDHPGFGPDVLSPPGAMGRLLTRLRSRPGHRPAASGARPGGLTPADERAYESVLTDVYAACNAQDLDALAGLATPGMVERFADRFASDVREIVTGLRLHRMRPVAAWSQDGLDRATVHMRYSMTVIVQDGYGRVLHGVCPGRVGIEEVWTYARHGRWLLEAIERGSGSRGCPPCGAHPAVRPARPGS